MSSDLFSSVIISTPGNLVAFMMNPPSLPFLCDSQYWAFRDTANASVDHVVFSLCDVNFTALHENLKTRTLSSKTEGHF